MSSVIIQNSFHQNKNREEVKNREHLIEAVKERDSQADSFQILYVTVEGASSSSAQSGKIVTHSPVWDILPRGCNPH